MSKRKQPEGGKDQAGPKFADPTPTPPIELAIHTSDIAVGAAAHKKPCPNEDSSSDEAPLSPCANRPPGAYPPPSANLEDASLTAARAMLESPPRRTIPQGSPAAAFLISAPPSPDSPELDLTCDLSSVPREKWNKRRTMSAVIISVLPTKVKGTTIRRNVILRDQHGECTACVWGNHTQIVNESTVGKPITILRAIIQEYEGNMQVAMPKDGSLTLGPTPKTTPITSWVFAKGNQSVTISTAIAMQQSDVFSTHGIIAQVVSEKVTTKDGKSLDLTTVSLASGPPCVILQLRFWHAKPHEAQTWTDMQHQAVSVTMIRCKADTQRGNSYESIGTLTKISKIKDQALETWWLKPE
jgi:hypothetical protein